MKQSGYIVRTDDRHVSVEYRSSTWIFFAPTETMSCDGQELHVARRTIWGKWKRYHYATSRICQLRREFRPRGKASVPVLTFLYDGFPVDILESLNWTNSETVLNACKALGIDVIELVDNAAAMQRDIDRRGWFINPLKKESD